MKTIWKIPIFSACLFAAFLAGSWFAGRPGAKVESGMSRVLYYSCPMHPEYRSDRPGDAPCCGMRLEPVYEGGAEEGPDVPAGAIHVSAQRQQMIGVRLEEVKRMRVTPVLRTIGRVETDQTRVYRITAATNGWVEEAMQNSVGSLVAKDQILATYYAPEFLSAQQAFFYALDARDRHLKQNSSPAQMSSTNVQVQSGIDNLKALGMTAAQIEQLSRSRERAYKIEIRAPASGFILERNVSPGQRFDSGEEFYRIADLSHIWVLADLFENEAADLRAGQTAVIRYRGNTYDAKVSEVLPIFDDSTRTLKVRLELDNPGYRLRPGMFVDVLVNREKRESLIVPFEAVTNTGLRNIVFVDAGSGIFEQRRVEAGMRFGEDLEITGGLVEGERIAVSGTFLMDSESRMRSGVFAASSDAEAVDPVCGMKVDPKKAGKLKSDYKGKTYYFCNPSCKDAFDKDPQRFLKS